MFKTNAYFDGNVMSIAMDSAEGNATVGVIAKGEYEFGTATIEFMTVIAGKLDVLLPGETEWKAFRKFETFRVEKGVRFKVRADEDVPYFCLYK